MLQLPKRHNKFPSGYLSRYVDSQIHEDFGELPAIAIDGPKSVGKTETALRHVEKIIVLDRKEVRAALELDMDGVLQKSQTICVDEWQRYPEVWDGVRRLVDQKSPTRFLLTGSASPVNADTHSGAGRIVSMRMRPMALSERASTSPTIFIGDVLEGRANIAGSCAFGLSDYVREICASGFPEINRLSQKSRKLALESYVRRIIDRDLVELGVGVRHPRILRNWMAAYAASSSSTTNYNKMLDAVTPQESNKPSENSMRVYRELLQKIWVLDPVPAWTPAFVPLKRMTSGEKHQLCDPGIAAHLMGATEGVLLSGTAGAMETLGSLFESLATLTVRAAAENELATVSHLRTRGGNQEIDLIVETWDSRVLAIEVKLARDITDSHVKHLHWLGEQIGDRLIDKVVINAGSYAFRRPDGVAVIPLSMVG